MLPTVSVETDTDNTFISSTVLKITCLLLPTEIQLSVCQWSKQSCRVHSFHGLGKQSSHGLSDYRVDLEQKARSKDFILRHRQKATSGFSCIYLFVVIFKY